MVKMRKIVENDLESHYTPVAGAVLISMAIEMILSILSIFSRLEDTGSTSIMPFY